MKLVKALSTGAPSSHHGARHPKKRPSHAPYRLFEMKHVQPSEDVAELNRLYASAPAQARITVLKAAFRSRNDADGLQFMTKMIGEGGTR